LETDWLAGAAGFEPAHLDERRLFEASKEFPAISMNQGIREFRLEPQCRGSNPAAQGLELAHLELKARQDPVEAG
jgi:hypothetical protein